MIRKVLNYRSLSHFIFLTILIYRTNALEGQVLYDKHWILSNYIHFVFNQNDIYTEIIEHPQGLTTSPFNTAMSSKEGELLFHTSGCFIMDKSSNIMENGDSLNPGVLEIGYCKVGDAIWYQDVIIIPYPGSEGKYILFTLDIGRPFIGDTMYYPLAPLHMYYHIIDMVINNGQGSVIGKNTVAISDTLAHGYLQACKHANGRDWWVIVPEWNSNCYYSIYVGPDSVSQPQKYCLGQIHGDIDFGSSVGFSSDGSWYARSYSWSEDTSGHLNLYSFDRCIGQLSEAVNLQFPAETPYYSGISFSPNSQYLYISSYKSLWQFDLFHENIQNSLVLAGKIENNFTSEKGSLYFQQLAPDARIYIASPFGHKYLSTIHYPDKKGLECGFKAHDLKLPLLRQNYAGLPNYSNYRLGPLDEGSCDTLEIDNIPVANFRYEIDSLNPLQVGFINLSYFQPGTFSWNLGDGFFSDLRNPSHIYLDKGNYEVCLTASNAYGDRTYCQEIMLLSTSVVDAIPNIPVSVYPIPAENELIIRIDLKFDYPIELKIYDIFGKVIFRDTILSETSTYNIDQIPSGIYLMSINLKNNQNIYTNKIIVIN